MVVSLVKNILLYFYVEYVDLFVMLGDFLGIFLIDIYIVLFLNIYLKYGFSLMFLFGL